MMLFAAVIILLVVVLLAFSGRLGGFGRLPGDIRRRGERTSVYFPVTSMLLLSLLASLVLSLLSWLF